MLKKPGGALRAFIGAGFCAVILSLSACASKGAADIPIGGIVNVGGGGNVVEPELQVLPDVDASTTLDRLGTASLTPDTSEFRSGGVPVGFGPITEQQYEFIDSSVFVQQLEFAHLGVWMDGDVADDTLRYRYANLAENIPATPPAASIGTATYNVEGDALFNGLRFYPDGELAADFANGTIVATIGSNTSLDDNYGPGATLPNGDPINGGFQATLRGTIIGGEFSGNVGSVSASGFFSPLDMAFSGRFSGRFHDADAYDGTVAPDELSGVFNVDGGLSGGFIGELQ